MFRLFGELVRNERAVKEIFDHFKNLAIAALVIAVGMKVYMSEQAGFFEHAKSVSGVCMMIIGFFLVILNERRGMYLLNKSEIPTFLHLFILLTYGLSMIVLVQQLVMNNAGLK